jgi:hypothetical protein
VRIKEFSQTGVLKYRGGGCSARRSRAIRGLDGRTACGQLLRAAGRLHLRRDGNKDNKRKASCNRQSRNGA